MQGGADVEVAKGEGENSKDVGADEGERKDGDGKEQLDRGDTVTKPETE